MPTPTGGADKTGVADKTTGVDNSAATGSTQPGKDPKLTARERALASMDAKILAQREADHAQALAEGNPIALALEAERLGVAGEDSSFEAETQIRPAATAATRKIPEVSGMDDDGTEEEAAPAVAAAPARAAPTKPAVAADTAPDPLADFTVVKDGKPMVQLKVDGQIRLIPVEQARAQLQKATAAELRLQQATEVRKHNERVAAELATREANIKAREAKFQPSVVTTAADDPALQREANDLVKSLLSDSPEVAAAKLAGVLVRTRQAATPAVNEAAIIEKATAAAKQSIKADEANKDVVEGFTSFERDYPEIAQDPKLFRYADSLSDVIKTEHPEWAPSKIMAEAGKQTREWIQSLTGAPAPAKESSTPVAATNSRQQAKNNIRPAPVVRAVSRSAASQEGDAQLSPANVLAEIRRSRGQAA